MTKSFGSGAVARAPLPLGWPAVGDGRRWLPAGTALHRTGDMLVPVEEMDHDPDRPVLLAYNTQEGEEAWILTAGVVYIPHLPGGLDSAVRRALEDRIDFRMELRP